MMDDDEVEGSLARLARLPEWLLSAADGDKVGEALVAHVPQLGGMRCTADRLRLKNDCWTAIYYVEDDAGPGDASRQALNGRLVPPGRPTPEPGGRTPFDSPGWSVWLPELRLEIREQPDDAEVLPALPRLLDADAAARLLQDAIHRGSPRLAGLSIERVRPHLVRYKPASRMTILYDLEYATDADPAWPSRLVAKIYHGEKGENAFHGMQALWESPLGTSDAVRIAEPLAYVQDGHVLVQGPIPEETTFKEELLDRMRDGTPVARAALDRRLRAIAAGLAALHGCGVHYGEPVTWEDELAEVRELLDRLASAVPATAGAAAPLLDRLEALHKENPPDPAVPAHRSFRPAQVLISGEGFGFIDFDGVCQAEPGIDIGLFCATLKNIGLKDGEASGRQDRDALLADLQRACDEFVDGYAAVAELSRIRVALWEALAVLTYVLHCWSKVKPQELPGSLAMLRAHVRRLDALTSAEGVTAKTAAEQG